MGMKGPVFEAREPVANVVRLEKWMYYECENYTKSYQTPVVSDLGDKCIDLAAANAFTL